MARVLVTGINGFTGAYLARALKACGHFVIGTARHSDHDSAKEADQILFADLADAASLNNVLQQSRPDHVMHFAAISSVAHRDVDAIYKTNLIGTLNLLQALCDSPSPIDRVLLASTAHVYGNSRGGRLNENSPASPSNHYGISKLAMEQVAGLYADRLSITTVRPFNYTGVGQSTNFIIPKLIDSARRRITKIELGDLDVSRDFSDVRAIVDCFVRLLDAPNAVGGIFNVCSGQCYRLRDVITMIEELADLTFEIGVNPAFVRRDEIQELYGCNDRLEAAIGPTNMPNLRETLRWMLKA
jgi:nucleoside-diphosphate-sugar epimerase